MFEILVGDTSSASVTATHRERYTPYGIGLDAPSVLDDQADFTGHIHDNATGLSYMQARYYDPVLGRFLSHDPMTFFDTGDVRFFNRYAYAFNDPVNWVDPDGENPWRGLTHLLHGTFKPPVERANISGTNIVLTRDESGAIGVATVPVRNLSQDTTEGIAMVGTALAVSAGSVAPNIA